MIIKNKVLIVLIILFSLSTVNAQFSVGILGGASNSGLNEDEIEDGIFKNRLGFAAGILGEYRFSNDLGISIQPMYIEKGVEVGYGSVDSNEPRDSIEININYISFPVLMKVYAGTDIVYVSGGLDIGYRIDASFRNVVDNTEKDITDSFKEFNIGAIFGVGAQFRLGHLYIFLEGRYLQSISSLSNSNPDDPPEINSSFRLTGFQLLIGLTYSFGGGRNED